MSVGICICNTCTCCRHFRFSISFFNWDEPLVSPVYCIPCCPGSIYFDFLCLNWYFQMPMPAVQGNSDMWLTFKVMCCCSSFWLSLYVLHLSLCWLIKRHGQLICKRGGYIYIYIFFFLLCTLHVKFSYLTSSVNLLNTLHARWTELVYSMWRLTIHNMLIIT